MSARAIQRLREQRESNLSKQETLSEEEDDDDDDEDEHEESPPSKKGGFAAMLMDDSDSDSDETDEDGDKEDDNNKVISVTDDKHTNINNVDKNESKKSTSTTATKGIKKVNDNANNDDDDDNSIENDNNEEDLDALLEELKVQDEEKALKNKNTSSTMNEIQNKKEESNTITQGMDIRHLDMEYVMRTSLLGASETSTSNRPNNNNNRRSRQTFMFGPPRDGWVKPPHYVGGGIGMTTYDNHPRSLPWPYNEMKQSANNDCTGSGLDRWFTFQHSDSYEKDCEVYEQVKASGDPNTLALFVAHHPYVVEALLQLSTVLYQTNQSQEGLALLRRALWVYECSSLPSFARIAGTCYMDYDQPENIFYFQALFRLIRVSYVAGLPKASQAVSRYLLSLDPQRDPMGVLLCLDHHALLSNDNDLNDWLVSFVENNFRVLYQDDSSSPNNDSLQHYECDILDLPNWAYSYALALYRINQSNPSPDIQSKANDAIQAALSKFPTVLDLLLNENQIDTTARSFRVDWPSAIGYTIKRAKQIMDIMFSEMDPVVRAYTTQSYDTIVKIFIQQNYKLWNNESILCWVYDNLSILNNENNSNNNIDNKDNNNNNKNDTKKSFDGDTTNPAQSWSPALARYAKCDPADYEDKFQTMPADANPLDPNLVGHALNMDPNRPRFMQRMPRGGAGRGGGDVDMQHLLQGGGPATLLPGPNQIIDPDWPILEVFLRSALPWNHVEGVPPPRPPPNNG